MSSTRRRPRALDTQAGINHTYLFCEYTDERADWYQGQTHALYVWHWNNIAGGLAFQVPDEAIGGELARNGL